MKKYICTFLAALVLSGCGKDGGKNSDGEQNTSAPADTVLLADSIDGQIANTPPYSTLTDSRDGQVYKTVKIGSQVWMAENLNYAAEGGKCYGEKGGKIVTGYDRGGNPVKKKKSPEKEVQGNCTRYGRLYNWAAAMKTCPAGWHLATDAEWTVLTDYVGGSSTAGTKLKSKTGWYSYNGAINGNGTDEYGFAALPGGSGIDGYFEFASEFGTWWSATANGPISAWVRSMYAENAVNRGVTVNEKLLSVRCVQDDSNSTSE